MEAPLSLPEAARRAGVSPTSVRRWVASGSLKATKNKDGSWTIQEGELRAFMATTLAARGASGGGLQRSGAEGKAPVAPSVEATGVASNELLVEALRREKQINDELRAQNKELQGEILKLSAEMLSLLKGEGKGLLSRWIRK